jgi:hypothetical protein
MRTPWKLSTAVALLLSALLLATLLGCGEDDGVGGPAIISTADAGDASLSSGDGATSDTGRSSGTGSGGTSGAADAAGDPDTSSGGSSSGGSDTTSTFVCVNDFDCSALLDNLPDCQIGRCVNNVCQPGPADDDTACDDGTACTTGDGCVAGTCEPGAFTCDDGNLCTEDSCDAATGKCKHQASADGVITKCDDDKACTEGDTCKGDKCVGADKDCDDSNPCTNELCKPASGDTKGGCQFTNNTKACGDGDKCFSAGQCDKGKCVAGKKLTCDDKNDCTADSCDAATGLCKHATGTKPTCDDGNACTKGDTCKDGKCASGATKVCDDKNACTTDGCSADSGDCSFVPSNKLTCDDGDVCVDKYGCADGKCVVVQPKLCDDETACTDGVCQAGKGCVTTHNTAACADNEKCVLGSCKAGKCDVGTKAGCNDNNVCTADACVNGKCSYKPATSGKKCKDGDKCQAVSTCQQGKCKLGQPVDCSDGNQCTTDGCNPKTGCVWESSSAACDDGDACTTSDDCASGKCKGTPKVGLCDDGNACTADSCDKAKGCLHAPADGACDDGNVCTKGEKCGAGKCGDGAADQCDDNKQCTVDNCDPKDGKCSWTGKNGACNDGDECTVGDYCKTGKCLGKGANTCDDKSPCTVDSCDTKAGKCVHTPTATTKPVLCDDGDKCTKGDSCKSGKCTGAGGLACDDGNTCTNDKCNPETGKCGFSANSAPCDNNNKCTWGDTCKNGKCATGANFACDDGQPCTTDSCDPKTGKCGHKPLAAGAKCDDGEACSTGDACKTGKCVAKDRSKCALFKDLFACEAAAKGWNLENTKDRAVIWAVDNKPSVAKKEWGCSLNFNNNVNYCDKYTSSNGNTGCYTPTGVAYSPLIDGTQIKGTPRLIFDTYYDVDAQGDNPRVELRNALNQYIYGFSLKKSEGKKWRHMEVNVPQAKGQKFRVRFYLSGASGQSGNTGAGWFVDNLTIDQKYTDEICNDGVDNDNNGQVDCLDITCKGKSTCKEVCDDGKDNDFDDKIDCADSDCGGALECAKPLFYAPMNCGDGGWKSADMKRNGVKFAIDKHAKGPKPVSGECTLNFNNGSNFCGVKDCKNGKANANAGTATWGTKIDATKFKNSLTLVYWSWIDGEAQSGSAYYDDRGFMQASYDGFAGCCGATNACDSSTLNQCNKTATSTWNAPRASDQQKKWQKVTLNLYKFRGKKFTLRARFNSGDGNNNTGHGWFIDDLRLYAK